MIKGFTVLKWHLKLYGFMGNDIMDLMGSFKSTDHL